MPVESGNTGLVPGRRLLDQVSDAVWRLHYSRRTEEAYRHWIRRFIFFHGKRHPAALGEPEVTAFLSHLATGRKVAASTQNQALSALLFLYTQVLGRDLGWLDGVVRAKRPVRAPVVLTRDEVQRLLAGTCGQAGLAARLLYGTGMCLPECLRLRVKDADFSYRQIVVRDGKGRKDRVTILPASLIPPLEAQLARARLVHGHDIRTVQELLGHADVSTTMIYTHVLNKGGRGVTSPLDRAEQPRAQYAIAA